MKKFFYSVFALATMLLATTSCSQEMEEASAPIMGGVTSFSVSLNGATGTRAYADGSTANKLYYEVYQNGQCVIDNVVDIATTTKVELPLLKGETYDIIFWAQAANNTIYNVNNLAAGNLKEIEVTYNENTLSNMEAYDAFYNALPSFKADSKTHTIDLRRPFAQLNLGTSDWGEVKVDDGKEAVTHSKVVVKGLAKTFAPLTGVATGDETATFNLNTIPDGNFNFEIDDNTYKYLSMNYLLVPGEKAPQGLDSYVAESGDSEGKANVDLTFTLNRDEKELFEIEVPNAPVQRNWRTNVVGELLTSTSFDVIIQPGIDGDYNTNALLKEVLTKGGEFTLTSDITLGEDIEVLEGVNVKINLNGKTLTLGNATIVSNGNLNIAEGTIDIKSSKASDLAVGIKAEGGSVNIENATVNVDAYTTAVAIADDKEAIVNITNTKMNVAEGEAFGVFANLVEHAEININESSITNKAFHICMTSADVFIDEKSEVKQILALGGSTILNITYLGSEENKPEVQTDELAVVNWTKVLVLDAETNITDLQEEINNATEPIVVQVKTNTNEDQITVPTGKDVTFIGGEVPQMRSTETVATFKGYIKVNGKLTLKNITIYTPEEAVTGEVSQFNKSAIALQNTGEVYCENVTFEMGNLQDATAITAWWSTGDGANITVKNCTFNCNGQRPIRSDACVTIENCVFNDPYRYAVQMTSKSSTMTADKAYVNFYNNIINAGTSTDKPVYGVQLEGEAYGCSNLTINGAGNKINLGSTGKESAMYYCECGEKIDHKSIIWNTEVEPVHASGFIKWDENVYMINTAAGMEEFYAKLTTDKNTFKGQTVILANDIDMSGITWDSHAADKRTNFAGVFDGNNKTISNFTATTSAGGGYATMFDLFSGEVKNLTLKNVTATDNDPAGRASALVGYMSAGKLSGVTVEGATITGFQKVAGLVSHPCDSEVYIENCHVKDVTLKASGSVLYQAGGLAGFASGFKKITVSGCSVENITIDNAATAEDCDNKKPYYCHPFIGCIDYSNKENKAEVIFANNEVKGTNTQTDVCRVGSSDYFAFSAVEGTEFRNNANLTITIDGNKYVAITIISNVDDLKWLAEQVNTGANNFSKKTVKLVKDIDLQEKEWNPIGNSEYKFQGTFDAQNHTISNLLVMMEGKSNAGLFGMTTDGEIKNLTVHNAKVTGHLNVGVIAGTPYTSKYNNIKVTGHVEVNGLSYVGGVGGKNAYANWSDVIIDVDATSYVKAYSIEDGTAYRTYVGGACGFNGEGSHTFTNVKSNIDVIGSTQDVGGLFGIAHYGNQFINCSSSGNVKITDATKAGQVEEMGGIAGVWHNGGADVVFENCSFTGTLDANIKEGVNLSDNTIVGSAYSTSGNGNLIIK